MPNQPKAPPTFEENVASAGRDIKRSQEEMERMQRALDEHKQAKWKKKGLAK